MRCLHGLRAAVGAKGAQIPPSEAANALHVVKVVVQALKSRAAQMVKKSALQKKADLRDNFPEWRSLSKK